MTGREQPQSHRLHVQSHLLVHGNDDQSDAETEGA